MTSIHRQFSKFSFGNWRWNIVRQKEDLVMTSAPVIEIGVLGNVVIWALIIMGIINTIICLATCDWFSAIFSVIAIFASVWFYTFTYKCIAAGYTHSTMHGLVCWAGFAIPWMINSMLWGALSMKLGQAVLWNYFNVFLLATLICPC